MDGSVPRRPGSVGFVYDLSHLARRRLLGPVAWLRQNWRVARLVRQAEHVVATSESVTQELIRYLRVRPERITTIMPGVGRSFRRPSLATTKQLQEKLRLPPRYFVGVGTICRRRNLSMLLSAWRQAASGVQGAELVLAGITATGSGAEATAAANTPGVRLLGYVKPADLPALLSGAISYLNASPADGCGIGVLEAMACGTPTLVSWHGALAEMSGGAGIVLDPDDPSAWAAAMTLMVRQPDLRAQLGRRARARAEEFSAGSAAVALDRALNPDR